MIATTLISIISHVSAQTTTTNVTQYKDPQNRFSIQYPLWWNTTGQPDRFSTTLLNSGDGYGTDMILGQLSTNQDPQTFATLDTSNLPYGYSLFQPVECAKYKIDGQKVCSYIEVKQGDTSINQDGHVVMQLITNINGKAYDITFEGYESSFDSMLPIFGAMVHSLHFTGNSTGVTSK
jgi:hypothetical protein